MPKTADLLEEIAALKALLIAADARDTADMVERACRLAFKDGFAKAGRRVIIVAGVPLGTPGATNMIRIAFVGAETMD